MLSISMNAFMTGRGQRVSKKEEFFQSLDAATWCGWDWCRKVYGYQVTDPDFLKRVYDRLDELNRGRVKNIYSFYVKTEIAHQTARKRIAAEWLADKTHKEYERKVREWQKKQFLNNSQQSSYLIWQNKKLLP